jgi:hypothetical protein
MIIALIEPKPGCAKVRELLVKWIENSRFRVESICLRTGPGCSRKRFKGGEIQLLGVRLKTPKFYYGNGPVANSEPSKRKGWNRNAPRKPAKLSFLEGLDWIEFNDSLNDFCDHHKLRADISSARCVIRRGWLRRTKYDFHEFHSVPVWKQRELPGAFVDSRNCPLIPFSTTNGDPSGFYKMLSP